MHLSIYVCNGGSKIWWRTKVGVCRTTVESHCMIQVTTGSRTWAQEVGHFLHFTQLFVSRIYIREWTKTRAACKSTLKIMIRHLHPGYPQLWLFNDFTLYGACKYWSYESNTKSNWFCFYVTGQAALRQRIMDLQKYRLAGLRCLHSGKMYDRLCSSQQNNDRHLLSDVLRFMKVVDCSVAIFSLMGVFIWVKLHLASY